MNTSKNTKRVIMQNTSNTVIFAKNLQTGQVASADMGSIAKSWDALRPHLKPGQRYDVIVDGLTTLVFPDCDGATLAEWARQTDEDIRAM